MVSEKHAGFIVNLGNATSSDIMKLIIKIMDIVEKHYDIRLEPEVRFLGFDEEFYE
jgi:UDP-N-acetylmuramate dehydrogenase